MNDRILRNIDSAHAVPEIITRLIEVTDDPDSDRRDVVRVLSSDTEVVIDVLRLANSGMYGNTAEIASLLHLDIVSGKIFAVVADAISESFRASPV